MSAQAQVERVAGGIRGAAAKEVAARLRRRAASERRWASLTLWIGIGIVAAIVFFCVAAPLLGFVDPNAQDLSKVLQPPSLEHPFGTDTLGRDILTRVLYGGRIDLTFAFVTTIIPFALGALVGRSPATAAVGSTPPSTASSTPSSPSHSSS